MSSDPRSRRAAPTTPFVPSPWLVLAALVVATLIVQRHALHEYFALDDLILFQQAAGIRAWPVTAWRWLSGWAWFRAVVPMWGHEPFPYHAASLAVHVVNVVLLQRVLRRLGASEIAAFVGTAAFALSRLHFPALLAATSIGELLALTFVLVAVLVMGRPRVGALAIPAMLLAVSAKESVFLVPFAMLLLVESSESFAARARRLAPALATGAIAGALLLASGIGSGRLGGEAYSVSFGANLAENIARLFGWTIDLFDPIPDLHAATAGAAHLVLPLVALTALAWWRGGALVRVGAAWWWLAVLPVLPLPGRTYLHYLYVALAGAAMIVAALWDAVLARRPQASGRARCRGSWRRASARSATCSGSRRTSAWRGSASMPSRCARGRLGTTTAPSRPSTSARASGTRPRSRRTSPTPRRSRKCSPGSSRARAAGCGHRAVRPGG